MVKLIVVLSLVAVATATPTLGGGFELLNNIATGISEKIGLKLKGLESCRTPVNINSALNVNVNIGASSRDVYRQTFPKICDLHDRMDRAHLWTSVCLNGGSSYDVCQEQWNGKSCPSSGSAIEIFASLGLTDGNGNVNCYDQANSIVADASGGEGVGFFSGSEHSILSANLDFALFLQNNYNNLDRQSYAVCTKNTFIIFGAISEAHKKGDGINLVDACVDYTNKFYAQVGLGVMKKDEITPKISNINPEQDGTPWCSNPKQGNGGQSGNGQSGNGNDNSGKQSGNGNDNSGKQSENGNDNNSEKSGNKQDNSGEKSGNGNDNSGDQSGKKNDNSGDQSGNGNDNSEDQSGNGNDNNREKTGNKHDNSGKKSGSKHDNSGDQSENGNDNSGDQSGSKQGEVNGQNQGHVQSGNKGSNGGNKPFGLAVYFQLWKELSAKLKVNVNFPSGYEQLISSPPSNLDTAVSVMMANLKIAALFIDLAIPNLGTTMEKLYVGIGKGCLCADKKANIDFCTSVYFNIGQIKNKKDIAKMKETLELTKALDTVNGILNSCGPLSESIKVIGDVAINLATIFDAELEASVFATASTQVTVGVGAIADSCQSGVGEQCVSSYYKNFVPIWEKYGCGKPKHSEYDNKRRCRVNKKKEDRKAPWWNLNLNLNL